MTLLQSLALPSESPPYSYCNDFRNGGTALAVAYELLLLCLQFDLGNSATLEKPSQQEGFLLIS